MNTLFLSLKQWLLRRKSKKILSQALDLYAKRGEIQSLDAIDLETFLKAIRVASYDIDTHNFHALSSSIETLQHILQKFSQKSLRSLFLHYFFMITGALIIALCIRQTCCEMYEIPTGSMRPTFKEKDRVFVSKTSFGLNIPLVTAHFSFLPNRITRGVIGVISGDNLDLPDVDTRYFGLFPGKRRYVKRIVGKPGDWIYFYGGQIYVLEKNGTSIQPIFQDEKADLNKLEYIPFIHFEGKTTLLEKSEPEQQGKILEIQHMNLPIARIEYSPKQGISSSVFNFQEKKWVPQFSEENKITRSTPQTLGDFWGIKNFAKSRLVQPSDLPLFIQEYGYKDSNALLWMELSHSPKLLETKAIHLSKSYISPITTGKTWIPLHKEHCQRLTSNLYTARFVVQDGKLYRYHHQEAYKNSTLILPRVIEDGIYEFYYGKAYSISQFGTAKELSQDHPIYPKTPEELLFWYNTGIDMNREVMNYSPFAPFPTRYAYFKNGNFMSMGATIFIQGDPILIQFQENEICRQARDASYTAFQDHGSPQEQNDPLFIKTYGLKIPEKQYLLLGDNHAMSVDSRYFGTVPEQNIEGSPILLLWPFGERFGFPRQISTPFLSPYSLLILITITAISYRSIRKSRRQRESILYEICEREKEI